MGLDASATALIGVRVFREKLFRKEKVKIGEHDFPPEILYHPQTGELLWDEYGEVPIDGFPQDGYGEFLGFSIKKSFTCEDVLFLCCIHVCTGSHRGNRPYKMERFMEESLSVIRDDMKVKLSPLGLWDEEEFGLWAILDMSW